MDIDQPLDLSMKSSKPAHSSAPVATANLSLGSMEIVQLLTKPQAPRTPCPFCCTIFTSQRTLQAHIEFYCAKKASESTSEVPEVTPPEDSTLKPQTPTSENSQQSSVSGKKINSAVEKSELKNGSQFCPHCAFRANTVRGLRSHITKYHSKDSATGEKELKVKNTNRPSVIVASRRSRLAAAVPVQPLGGGTEKKKHCKYCDISFKYLSTFLAHRKYYCTVRKEEQSSGNAKNENAK